MIAATDHDLLRESAGLLDRSERGKLILSGTEAAEFLQGQVTNDVEGLAPGTGCYAALLDHKGRMRADMRILRGPDWILIDTEPAGLAPIAKTVKVYSLGRDVRWEDETAARAVLSIIGPRARAAFGDEAPPATEHAFVEGRYGLHVATDAGVDVICPSTRAQAVQEDLGLELVSTAAAECLRIESGRPRHGLDVDEATIPQEAGLNERAVSFEKGCYVGQETVARLFYKGKPNRRLLGLSLSVPASSGDELAFGERIVGRVGSACVSPVWGPIALALVRREAEPGDTVLVGAECAPAEVVTLPFR